MDSYFCGKMIYLGIFNRGFSSRQREDWLKTMLQQSIVNRFTAIQTGPGSLTAVDSDVTVHDQIPNHP